MDFVNNCLIRVIKRIICRKYHAILGKGLTMVPLLLMIL
jgi:hypothetical protein